jgi:hypothetical protein
MQVSKRARQADGNRQASQEEATSSAKATKPAGERAERSINDLPDHELPRWLRQ